MAITFRWHWCSGRWGVKIWGGMGDPAIEILDPENGGLNGGGSNCFEIGAGIRRGGSGGGEGVTKKNRVLKNGGKWVR